MVTAMQMSIQIYANVEKQLFKFAPIFLNNEK